MPLPARRPTGASSFLGGFATGPTGSAVTGGPMVSNYSPIYGGIPGVPDPTVSTRSAIAGNATNLPQLQNLGAGINSFNQAQALQGLEQSVPGLAKLNQQSSTNIAQELAGEVPDDVVNNLITSAAERGILTGSPGSPNANAAYLRALGLTSLGQKQTGQANLTAAVARAPQVPLFNLSSMMTTPEMVQDADLTRNIYASAPVPEAAGKYAEDLYLKRLAAAKKLGAPSYGSATWAGTRGGTRVISAGSLGDDVVRGI